MDLWNLPRKWSGLMGFGVGLDRITHTVYVHLFLMFYFDLKFL